MKRMKVTPRLVCAVLLAAGFPAAAGCANRAPTDLTKSANKVRRGMTQDQVREEMGAPDKKFPGVVRVGTASDPSWPVVGKIPGGGRYERWFYADDDTHYHVYFGRGATGRWEVVDVRANDAAAAVGRTSPPPPTQ